MQWRFVWDSASATMARQQYAWCRSNSFDLHGLVLPPGEWLGEMSTEQKTEGHSIISGPFSFHRRNFDIISYFYAKISAFA